VVHRDIKLDNILLDQRGLLKLGDFGVSRAIKNEILKDQCGTPAYIAPEVLLNKGYNGKLSDTWS
jgi:5'-AMP-activated protein kinase catalytic alpha subunit